MKYRFYNSKAKKIPQNAHEMIDLSTCKRSYSFTKNDEIHLYGGDGTLNKFINKYSLSKIILHPYGTGNDLARNFSNSILTYTYKLNEHFFINGFGCGIDAVICHVLNTKNKKTYFRSIFSALKNFHPFSLTIKYDQKTKTFQNVYLCSCQNGKYFGKGFKIAPSANLKQEDLQIVIAHNINKLLIPLLILFLKLGLHPLFKKYIFITTAKNITIKTDERLFQIDGETFYDNHFEIKPHAKIEILKNFHL